MCCIGDRGAPLWAHHAHSYVRGNWRREAEASFMLLTKSCHDLDWLNPRPPSAIGSLGWVLSREGVPGTVYSNSSHPISFQRSIAPRGVVTSWEVVRGEGGLWGVVRGSLFDRRCQVTTSKGRGGTKCWHLLSRLPVEFIPPHLAHSLGSRFLQWYVLMVSLWYVFLPVTMNGAVPALHCGGSLPLRGLFWLGQGGGR